MVNLRARIIVFGALCTWCIALLVARLTRSTTPAYQFLVWNLFLGIVPAVAAILFVRAKQTPTRVIWFVIWLLFLPNAPYIATDFVHLTPVPRVPLWFDVALLLSFAATGLLLGYTSLNDVQGVIARRFGATASWAFACAILMVSAFGIYLGRFVRINSWDVVTDPHDVAHYIRRGATNPLAHHRPIGVTLIYGAGLVVGYIAFYQLPRLRTNIQSP